MKTYYAGKSKVIRQIHCKQIATWNFLTTTPLCHLRCISQYIRLHSLSSRAAMRKKTLTVFIDIYGRLVTQITLDISEELLCWLSELYNFNTLSCYSRWPNDQSSLNNIELSKCAICDTHIFRIRLPNPST